MRLDKKLNFVFPIDSDENAQMWVHSAPISRIIFETYYDVLGKVFVNCFTGSDPKHVALAGPQLALPALKAAAKDSGTWEGPWGVENGFLNELIRLSNITFPCDKGWEQLPLANAFSRNIVDEDQQAEILSSLVFFTSISRTAPKILASTCLEAVGTLMGWRFTSSNSTDFMNSLPILTPAETIPTQPPSVVS